MFEALPSIISDDVSPGGELPSPEENRSEVYWQTGKQAALTNTLLRSLMCPITLSTASTSGLSIIKEFQRSNGEILSF